MRSVFDLQALGERTIHLDCDVLQADGGTRTAAITGAWVAAHDAVSWLLRQGRIAASPIRDAVAAVSVGIVQGTPLLDLEYTEDSSCDTDMNVVMTGRGGFVEVQGTAEGEPSRAPRWMRCWRWPPRASASWWRRRRRPSRHELKPGGFGWCWPPTTPSKLAELRALFAPLPLDIVAQAQLGMAEAEEPHDTFIENALAKARHAAVATGQARRSPTTPACAWMRSGGAPGVVSAHYASVELLPGEREAQRRQQDAANNALLLQRLQGVRPTAARQLRQHAGGAALRGRSRAAGGRGPLAGPVLEQPQGARRLRLRPADVHPGARRHRGRARRASSKNAHSHRALAGRQMLQLMREAWALA